MRAEYKRLHLQRATPRLRLEGLAIVDPKTAPAEADPKWCALFPVGEKRHRSDFPNGAIDFSQEFLSEMIGNWERLGKPMLPVDYGHDEGGIAAGWIKDMKLEGQWFKVLIDWTQRARAAIQAKELLFLSPSFSTNASDPLEGGTMGPTLFGAGLLNTPFLQDLPRVAASAVPNPQHPAGDEPKEHHMNKKQICALLGMPDDSTDDAVMERLTKRLKHAEPDGDEKKMSAAVEGAVALALKPVNEKLAALEAEKVELAKKNAALEAEKLAGEAKAVTELALKKGIAQAPEFVSKLVAKGGIAFAREMVEMTKGTVDTTERGSGASEELTRESAAKKLETLMDEAQKTHKCDRVAALELVAKSHPEVARLAWKA